MINNRGTNKVTMVAPMTQLGSLYDFRSHNVKLHLRGNFNSGFDQHHIRHTRWGRKERSKIGNRLKEKTDKHGSHHCNISVTYTSLTTHGVK